MFVYLFSVPLSTACKCHGLSVESHLSVQKIVSFWNIFISTPHMLSVWRLKAVEKNAVYFQPLYVPVVSYILNCSIYDTALILYAKSSYLFAFRLPF